MVRISNGSLCVGNNAVYPGQKLSRCLRIFKNDFVVRHIAVFCGSPIGSPPISANSLKEPLRFSSGWSVAESLQETLNATGRSIINYLHSRETRSFFTASISIQGYSTQKRALPFAPSSPRGAFGSKKRIVHLYQPNETVSRIPIGHGLTHFIGHQPRRLAVSDLQGPLHLGYRHPHFIHRHMIDQPIPRAQWRTGLMEYGACGQTDFCSTALAIKDLSRADEPCFMMPTSGAPESLRPSQFSQMYHASFFTRELFLKRKLDAFSVFSYHGYAPCSLVYRFMS